LDHQATVDAAQQLAYQYQQQAIDAQTTSNAFERLAIDATMQADQLTAQIDRYTAEAPPTPTPDISATQTQNAVYLVALDVQAGQMTAVKEAPTQKAALARAENEKWIYPLISIGQFMALLGVGVGILFLVLYALRNWPVQEEEAESEPTDQAIAMRQERGGYVSVDYLTFPGTPYELLVMADAILQDPSLADNRWDKIKNKEGGMLFTRPRFRQVCFWLKNNTMAIRSPRNEYILLDRGLDFFNDTMTLREPPLPYKVDPNYGAGTARINHNHDHDGADIGGEVVNNPTFETLKKAS
jgi:hypothetical protein